MNISVGYLKWLVLIKADVDASASEWHLGFGQWHEGLSPLLLFSLVFCSAHFLHAGNIPGQMVFNGTITGLFGWCFSWSLVENDQSTKMLQTCDIFSLSHILFDP